MFSSKIEEVKEFSAIDTMVVEGFNSKQRDILVEKIDDFFKSCPHLHLNGNRFYLNIPFGRMDNIRGSQTPYRVEIQGPEGDHHVRVAFQKDNFVLAQVVLPRQQIIPIHLFKQAFNESGAKGKGYILGSKNVVRETIKR